MERETATVQRVDANDLSGSHVDSHALIRTHSGTAADLVQAESVAKEERDVLRVRWVRDDILSCVHSEFLL
jgi:hypothetical protein